MNDKGEDLEERSNKGSNEKGCTKLQREEEIGLLLSEGQE